MTRPGTRKKQQPAAKPLKLIALEGRRDGDHVEVPLPGCDGFVAVLAGGIRVGVNVGSNSMTVHAELGHRLVLRAAERYVHIALEEML